MMADAQGQVGEMEQYIRSQADSRVKDIEEKGLQEFNIEKEKLLRASQEKIRAEYAKKRLQLKTQASIDKSTAINKSRLEKIKTRQEMIARIADDVKAELVKCANNDGEYKQLLSSLITQGLVMLLEEDVVVQCRQADKSKAEASFKTAEDEFKKITGGKKNCKLTLDSTFLPADCLGGVVLSCQGGTITIDNTIDARLMLVLEQDKPAIRSILFPLMRD